MMGRLAGIAAAAVVLLCCCACTGMQNRQGLPEGPAAAQNPSPITEKDFEEKAILEELTQVYGACMTIVEQMEPPEPNHFYTPTQEEYRAMVEAAGALGVPVAYLHVDMPNYQQVVDFAQSVAEGREDSLILYALHSLGPRAEAFYTRNGAVAVRKGTYQFARPHQEFETDKPYLDALYQLDYFYLTEKGFLAYAERDPLDGGARGRCLYRVLPYDDKLMELTEKYPLRFDRSHSNLLDCDWDAEHLDELHLLDIFETCYNDHHEEALEVYETFAPYGDEEYHFAVPALLVEETLQKHLPVTTEYLRSLPEYDAALHVYDWEREPRGGITPVPEVVDYRENADGSLTLTIDAVGYDYGSDREWTSVLTVRDNPDGSVFYLSCSTDFYEVYPFAHLQGKPVLTEPREAARMEDAAYRKFCQLVGPYLTTQPQYDWEYPGDGKGLDSRLRYVLALLEAGALGSGMDPEEFFSEETGRFELPREAVDGYLADVFDGLAACDDALVQEGLFSSDGTHYSIAPGGEGFDGTAYLNWAEDDGDRLRFTVHCYDKEGGYLCQMTFLVAPWPDIFTIHRVSIHWTGDPPVRP